MRQLLLCRRGARIVGMLTMLLVDAGRRLGFFRKVSYSLPKFKTLQDLKGKKIGVTGRFNRRATNVSLRVYRKGQKKLGRRIGISAA